MLPWCLPGSSLLTGPEGLLAKERENLKRLKYLRRYRQRYGVEALLHRQLKERRMLATEGAAQQVLESGCTFMCSESLGSMKAEIVGLTILLEVKVGAKSLIDSEMFKRFQLPSKTNVLEELGMSSVYLAQ